jgi:hypothetical protein
MNTILKTGTASTALLLTLVAPGAALASSAAPSRECRVSPTLVDQWARHGQPLPPCVVNHNLLTQHFGDDHRK